MGINFKQTNNLRTKMRDWINYPPLLLSLGNPQGAIDRCGTMAAIPAHGVDNIVQDKKD